ncbi:Rare lipoprotein A precursor [hydrothermal vent metagenome]|uniref:Rare lipoprotein A n=1 Tax=hydrothermal vent metagenome TaxID=652676 RepID=A0A1W1D484_9ZZZZ
MNKNIILINIAIVSLIVSGCSTRGKGVYYNNVSHLHRVEYVSSPEGVYRSSLDPAMYKSPTMKPYRVHGKMYYPHLTQVGARYSGIASWYGPDFHGKLTSNGEIYNMNKMTAAHKTLPIGTIVRVTNKRNGLSTVVRINDRGPFVDDRIIDLSKKAASEIDMIKTGTAPVVLEVIGFASHGKKRKKRYKKRKQIHKNIIAPYALQIASFSNIEGAVMMQEKYDGKDGYKSIIVDSMNNQGISTYKVLLKGFKSRNEVIRYKQKRHFDNAFIIREKG